jgi:hypothetical protein
MCGLQMREKMPGLLSASKGPSAQSACLGMPSGGVYSIVQIKKTNPYRAYAWNLFFPKSKLDIAVDGVSIAVESVSAREMTFRVK